MVMPYRGRTRWEGNELVRHKCILPPPPPPPPLDTGCVSRLMAETLGFVAAISLALFALTLVAGCNPGPPSTVSIGTEFTLEQRAEIVAGIDAWCDAVGWCPYVVTDGEGKIHGTRNYKAYNRTEGSAAVHYPHDRTGMGTNPGASEVIMDLDFADDQPECFRAAAWHELGHFGIEGHTAIGTMAASPECVTIGVIDDVSSARWCAQQGC